MTYDNFTIKAQESIVKAQQIAGGYEQQSVDTPHLIRGILETDEHTAEFLLKKMGVIIPTLKDKLDEAIPYLQRSIVEADDQNDLVVKKDATRRLSEVYRNQGDFTKALESYQAYVGIVDSLYIRKEQEISRAARFNREIATKQNRISSLEQERQLSQSKYDLAVTQQQLFQDSALAGNYLCNELTLSQTHLDQETVGSHEYQQHRPPDHRSSYSETYQSRRRQLLQRRSQYQRI